MVSCSRADVIALGRVKKAACGRSVRDSRVGTGVRRGCCGPSRDALPSCAAAASRPGPSLTRPTNCGSPFSAAILARRGPPVPEVLVFPAAGGSAEAAQRQQNLHAAAAEAAEAAEASRFVGSYCVDFHGFETFGARHRRCCLSGGGQHVLRGGAARSAAQVSAARVGRGGVVRDDQWPHQ